MSRRYTLHFTTSASDEPAASRIARTFSNVSFVSDRTSPSSRCPVRGLLGPCPATKTKSSSITAWEYGPRGCGAWSVCTAFLIGSAQIAATGVDGKSGGGNPEAVDRRIVADLNL